jgi:serine phosphatase RsbU (regulator of sigma subunit)
VRWALILALIAAAVLAVAILGGQWAVMVELAVVAASVAILSRILKRASPRMEAVRLIVGIPLYLLALAVQVLVIVFLSNSRIATPFTLTVSASLFPGAALAFSVLSVYRLRKPGEKPRRARIAFFVLLGVLLASTGMPSVLPAAVAVCAAVWAFPKGWLKDLAQGHRRRAIQLGIASPFAFFFAPRLNLGEEAVSNVTVPWGGSGVYTMVRLFVAAYWFSVLLHLALLSVRGASLRLPIRVRLGLTYLFSTVLPAGLTIVFIAVAMYAGIGALRARSARNLVLADLRALETRLREGPVSRASHADSLAEAVYLRVSVGAGDAGAETPDGTSATPTRDYLAQALPFLCDAGLGPVGTGPAADEPAECVAPSPPEIWVRVASHSAWTPPDTLPALPGWTDSVGTRSGILPVRGSRTYYAAAEPAGTSPCLVRTLLQPLNASVLQRYRELLGCDVIVDPAPRWNVRSEIGGGVVLGADRRWSFWPDAPAVTTVAEGGDRGLFQTSLYHGISDLHLAAGGSDGPTRIVALIMVRTSLADLASALYATGGMNTAIVLLLLILASLILVAVLFSSYLGFSLNRSITTAVAALRRGAERLGEGDLDARIELHTRDELSTLAGSFNRMASEVKRLVREVARRERIEREIQIARQIQVNMLPAELPHVEGYEIAGESYPAQEVAGDYYDAVLLEGGGMALVVADVSGKGVAAAMLMSNLHASLSVLLHEGHPLHRVAERLNVLIHRNSPSDMFVTFFVAVLDPQTGSVEYVNSGHDPPVVVKQDRAVELGATGLILGFMPDASYRAATVALESGDCLVMYSDGITEALSAAEEDFGRDRLVDTLVSLRGDGADEIVRSVIQRVRDHVGPERAPRDDLTLLLVKRVGGPAPVLPAHPPELTNE